MDLTVTRFQEIYKSRALRFGTSVQPASLSQRVGNLNQQRRISRHTVMMAKRKINEEMLTPIASPVVHPKKRKSQVVVEDEKKDHRLELLRKWQEEKRKRLQQQKATKKPLFKVHHVAASTQFDLDSVYGQIKGKAVAASAKQNPAQPRLAPSSTYKFRPPANIKPINMKTTSTAKTHIPKMKAEIVPSDRVTRSKRPLVSPPALQLPVSTRQRLNFQDAGTSKTGATKKVDAVKLGTKIGAKQENIKPTSKSQQNKPKRNTKKGPINLKSTEDEENLAKPLDPVNQLLPHQKNKKRSSSVGAEKAIKTPKQKGRSTRQNRIVTSPDVQMKVAHGNGKPDTVPESADNDVFVLEDVRTQINRIGDRPATSSSLSPEYPVAKDRSTINSGSSSSEPVTPLNKSSGPTVYVSPFVTMSRGKENARKEYHRRSARGGTDCDKSTSPQAAASYFYKLLTNQTERLQNMCEEWSIYKDEQKPPEGACEMIDVAAGQTNLLITKKFQQFKGLVESCRTGDSKKPVTCRDLHGFWDMVLIQVANLDKRFENLEKLKANAWEEILPIAKPKQTKSKRKTGKKLATTSSSSSLRAAIQEARKKKAAERPTSAEVLPTDSPVKPRRSSRHSNIRTSTTTSETRRSVGSPGLAMMRVSQAAKTAERSEFFTPNNDRTGKSPKSILKSEKSKSVGRKSKVVLFKERSTEDENQENNQNSPNMMFFSPPGGAKRRSGRLAKHKK